MPMFCLKNPNKQTKHLKQIRTIPNFTPANQKLGKSISHAHALTHKYVNTGYHANSSSEGLPIRRCRGMANTMYFTSHNKTS